MNEDKELTPGSSGEGRRAMAAFSASMTTIPEVNIANMNDAAVALLLEQRDSKAAIALLNDAVSLMIQTRRQRNQLHTPNPSDECTPPPSMDLSSCSIPQQTHTPSTGIGMSPQSEGSTAVPAPPPSDEVLSVSPSPLTLEADGGLDFYSRPFVFRHHLSPDETDRVALETCFAGGIAVCLYNMALCNHREWCKSRNKNDTGILFQVLSLYKKSLNILLSLKPGLSGSITILIAALCHNVSSIYYERGDLNQVTTWKQVLIEALAFVDTSRLDHECYQFFLMSTALSGVDTIAAGAA